jgi:hypothetical protein
MLFKRLDLGDYIIDRPAGMIPVIRRIIAKGEDAYPLSEEQQRRLDDARDHALKHFYTLRQLFG